MYNFIHKTYRVLVSWPKMSWKHNIDQITAHWYNMDTINRSEEEPEWNSWGSKLKTYTVYSFLWVVFCYSAMKINKSDSFFFRCTVMLVNLNTQHIRLVCSSLHTQFFFRYFFSLVFNFMCVYWLCCNRETQALNNNNRTHSETRVLTLADNIKTTFQIRMAHVKNGRYNYVTYNPYPFYT